MASASNASNIDTDVLVAGAGPVGLTLASELLRHSVGCRIVSKNSGVRETSKALILHVRTQEVFEAMGVVEQAKAEAKPLHQVELSAYGKHIGHWLLAGVDSPHSSPVILGQNRTEHYLEEHLNLLGGDVEWRVEATGFEQDPDGVTVQLQHKDGQLETVRALYIIGCEGSRSMVRETLGVPFEGGRYENEQFIQADAKICWTLPKGSSYLFLTDAGYMMAIEMPNDIVRIFISLPDPDPNNKTNPTLEEVQDALNRLASLDAELYDPVWLARYRTSHRGGSHGPKAGDRAPDATVVRLADRATVRLFQVMQGTQWNLLLFAGKKPDAEIEARLKHLTDQITTQYLNTIQTHYVTTVLPAQAQSVLVDRLEYLHNKYGVEQACLYLIRPDGYVGFRGSLSHAEQLQAYL